MDIILGGKDSKFRPRGYQMPLIEAFEKNKDKKRFVIVWPRRAGKDITVLNLFIRAALKKVGVYYYIFPEYAHAKRAIWDSITNDGRRFLDFIPKELVVSSNSQEMKIWLTNGSLIQFAGSNKFDALRGTNPQGIVFSEYGWHDPKAYEVFSPVLRANHGFAVFVSTPNGHNHFYNLFKYAQDAGDDSWFYQFMTIDDTQHMTQEDIDQERREGILSEDMIQQEYYCSFDRGVEGSYYSKYLQQMRLAERICEVPYDPGLPVVTAWDIGVGDYTSIIFAQYDRNTIKIIDHYQNHRQGLEHYVQVLRSKPYIYSKHIAPHDMNNMEFATGQTRIEKARELGIDFIFAPGRKEKIGLQDGIERVRTMLPRTYIDTKNCDWVIKTLDNYHMQYDNKHKVYLPQPAKSEWNHCADALRYLAVSLHLLSDSSITPEELDRRYKDVMGMDHDPLYGFNRW